MPESFSLRILAGVSVAILTLFVTPLGGIAQDPYVSPDAPEDDPLLLQDPEDREVFLETIEPCVREARRTYLQAKARFLAGLPPNHGFFVVVRLHDAEGRLEQVFVAVDRIEDGTIEGRIWSPVQVVEGYAYGAELSVPEKEIVDWVITKPDGGEEGNLIGKFIDRRRAGEEASC